MAESDSGQERSEEPTQKRKDDAREKGDIARSKELNTAVILLAGFSGLIFFGQHIAEGMAEMMSQSFSISRAELYATDSMLATFRYALSKGMTTLIPLFVILLIAAIVGPIALGGWVMSAKSLAPKWSRLSPMAGIKRMFSSQALMELVKAICKVVLVVSLSIFVLNFITADIIEIGKSDTLTAMITSVSLLGWAVLLISCAMILIVMIDVPFQIISHQRKLKMTHQEIKDEMKNSDGKPEVKARIRQLQYDISQRKMMSAVPEADVVITNPEHYAVALRYNSDELSAPIVVAKGADLMAQHVREIAKAHDVPIIESPPLTRAVFYSTEIDHEIPAGLYVAVAQVLAYVFQLQRSAKGQGNHPGKIPDVPIPADLQRDS